MPARIIFKAHYLSGKTPEHIENYIQYMGTRPGVEIFDDDGSPATVEQKLLIVQLIRDFGKEMTESFEYEDYIAKPTKANASAAITACLDSQFGLTETKENYIDYIANRPRVEKLGEHGLFSQTDAPIDLEETASEVAHQGNNVWTDIISLRREDAEKTGFDNAEAWRDLMRSKVETIARNYKIPMRDFVWYGAFHNEGHHPHIHFVCYSKGKEGYLTEKGIENIKSSLAHEIFRQDFSEIYDRQMQLRTNLKDESTQLMEQLVLNFSAEQYENTELKENIISLAERLDVLKGKKQYGYLPKDAKSLVDAITDELAEHENIAKLYDLWYEEKEEIMKIYKANLPSRVPLSENNEFTSIKNMIIREVNGLSISEENIIDDIKPVDISFNGGFFIEDGVDNYIEPIDDIRLFDDIDLNIDFSEFSDSDSSSDEIELYTPKKGEYHSNSRKEPAISSLKLYCMGKQFLQEGNALEALECFTLSANKGNVYAQYRLGRLYLDGEGAIEKDINQALHWLRKAAEQNNEYAQYTLGNLYIDGDVVEKDKEKGEKLLLKSAQQGNSYAAYRYGCILRDEYEENSSALEWIQKSADKNHPGALYTLCKINMKDDFTASLGYLNRLELLNQEENSYIAYYLGKLYLMEENQAKNVPKAISYLQGAAKQENDMAFYTLGKLYLDGKDIPIDVPLAISYLEKATELKNSYAEYQLGQLYIQGVDVPKDVLIGMQYLNSSAEKNNDMAQYALGKIYLSGEIVPKDVLQAEKLLIQSAEQENMYAQYTLGILYLKGEDVKKYIGASIGYLENSAENGNSSAQYQLGKLYFKGEEIQQNVNLGIQYIEQAIENGNDTAMCFLGRAYLVGDILPKDIHRGLELLQAASEQGNKYAEEMIKNFNFNVTHTSISILHKLSLILQNNTEAMAAKRPMMPAVDKKELIAVIQKKEEQGIRYD